MCDAEETRPRIPPLPPDPGVTFDSVHGARGGEEEAPTTELMPSVWQAANAPRLSPETPPAPAYTVQHLLGRGGFGEVWQAVQVSLNRTVAIKRLRPAEEPRGETEAREHFFRHEAFTTAALEHPNIVPVYDFGMDEHGQPMMAMKLVRGEPWNTILKRDFAELSAEEFLARHLPILVDVAQAVAFAHENGIVHRDLKPAQVMIGRFGEVLLMDWGLAIRTDEFGRSVPNAPVSSLVAPAPSEASSPAGTPAYMAPEQTLPDATQVGPWTDVYLLGGILYQLLSGTRPHDAPNAEAAFLRAHEGVVEDVRRRAPERAMPEDLAVLAMRALARDRKDRVPTVEAFLESLRSHLSGAARRQQSLAASGAVAAELATAESGGDDAIGALLNRVEQALLLWPGNEQATALRVELLRRQAEVATREGDLRLARLTIARMPEGGVRRRLESSLAAATAARARRERERRVLAWSTAALVALVVVGGSWFLLELRSERDRAEQARSGAEDLLGFMIGDLSDRLKPVGRLDVLDAVAEKAGAYLDGLPQDESNTVAWVQRARTRTRIGELRSAQGRLSQALPILETEAAALERRLSSTPGDRKLLAAAAEAQEALGGAYFMNGRMTRSHEAYLRAVAHFRSLAALEPGRADWRLRIAVALRGSGEGIGMAGNWVDALDAFREAESILRPAAEADDADARVFREYGVTLYREAAALQMMGRAEESMEPIGQSVKVFERAVARWREDKPLLNAQSESIVFRGTVCLSLERFEDAERDFRAAIKIGESLCAHDPGNLEWASDLAVARTVLGNVLKRQDRPDEAMEELEAARRIGRELTARNAVNAEWMADLSFVCQRIAEILLARGERTEALRSYLEAAEAMIGAAERDPGVPSYLESVSSARSEALALASQFYVEGDVLRAFESLETAAAILEREVALRPEDTGRLTEMLNLYLGTMGRALDWSDVPRAQSLLKAADATVARIDAIDPASVPFSTRGALVGARLRLCELNGDDAGVVRLGEEMARMLEELSFDDEGAERTRLMQLTIAKRRLAHAQYRSTKDAAAAEAAIEGILAMDRGMRQLRRPEAIFLLIEDANLAMVHLLAGELHRDAGRAEEARAAWEQAATTMEPYRDTGSPKLLEPLAIAYYLLGRREDAEEIVARVRTAGRPGRELQRFIDAANAAE